MQRISVLPDWLPSDRSALNDLLNRVASEFGLTATLFDVAGGGFSGAPVFRIVNADGQAFAAKCFPETNAEAVAALMLRQQFVRELVRESGFPLPVARTRVVALADSLVDPRGLWQVEPWMPGSPLESMHVNSQVLRTAVEFIATIHQAARRQGLGPQWQRTMLTTRRGVSPAITKRLELVIQLMQGELDELLQAGRNAVDAEIRSVCVELCCGIRQHLPQLYERLLPYQNRPLEQQPVFRDVRAEHLLFSEGRISGLIDLSLLATDHVLLDVTRLLRTWFSSDSARIVEGICCYGEFQKSTTMDVFLADVLDECGVVLSPVTWLRRLRRGEISRGISVQTVLNRLKEQADLLKNFTPIRQLLLKAENH